MKERTIQETVWATGRMLVGIALVAGSVLVFQRALSGRDAELRASCRPELMLLEAMDYGRDNGDMFPPLSPEPGRLTYDVNLMDPYIASPGQHVCASDDGAPPRDTLKSMGRLDAVNDWSYVYLGYCLENDAQGLAFVEAYRERTSKGAAFGTDIEMAPGTGNCGRDRLYRLREPAQLAEHAPCIADHPDRIPVVVEWPGHHQKPGGRVVYLDGHSEFLPYPGPFPMTERFIGALRELDHLGAPADVRNK